MAKAADSDCIRVENDLERLACYDRDSGRAPEVTATPSAADDWFVQTSTSALTDEVSVMLSVFSEEAFDCSLRKAKQATMYVRCNENTTALVVHTGCHMTSSEYNNYGDVTYRLDEQRAKTVAMSESTNNMSLGLWSGGKSIPLIKSMFGKSRMIIRMTPFGDNPITVTFNISGLENAAVPLRKACNW